jgi:hypothetical protein
VSPIAASPMKIEQRAFTSASLRAHCARGAMRKPTARSAVWEEVEQFEQDRFALAADRPISERSRLTKSTRRNRWAPDWSDRLC